MSLDNPIPPNEPQRLRALRRTALLDAPPRPTFHHICRIASKAFGTPVALITLVDQDRLVFKARAGLDAGEAPRAGSFCAHAILSSGPLIVEDARADPRFRDHPLVRGPDKLRFYAGVPLEIERDVRIGTMCVIDRRTRTLTDDERDHLRCLGDLVVAGVRRATLERRLEREAEQSRRQAALARHHRDRALLAGELTGMGWWEYDAIGGGVVWSAEVRRIHEIAPGARITLKRALEFYEPDARPVVIETLNAAIARRERHRFELPIRTAKGRRVWVSVVAQPVVENGAVVRVAGAIQDVTAAREAAQQAEFLAMHDGLTGLPNRTLFNRAIADQLRVEAKATALALIDLDHFKSLNDTLGHDGGDAALVEMGARLKARLRGEDTLARLGGDEFAVVLPGVGSHRALEAALTRLSGAADAAWRHGATERRLALSIGGALGADAGGCAATLYKLADLALYEAKGQGRGRTAVHRPMQAAA